MLHITNLEDGLELFKALGSDVRVRILEISPPAWKSPTAR